MYLSFGFYAGVLVVGIFTALLIVSGIYRTRRAARRP